MDYDIMSLVMAFVICVNLASFQFMFMLVVNKWTTTRSLFFSVFTVLVLDWVVAWWLFLAIFTAVSS